MRSDLSAATYKWISTWLIGSTCLAADVRLQSPSCPYTLYMEDVPVHEGTLETVRFWRGSTSPGRHKRGCEHYGLKSELPGLCSMFEVPPPSGSENEAGGNDEARAGGLTCAIWQAWVDR